MRQDTFLEQDGLMRKIIIFTTEAKLRIKSFCFTLGE